MYWLFRREHNEQLTNSTHISVMTFYANDLQNEPFTFFKKLYNGINKNKKRDKNVPLYLNDKFVFTL